MLQAPSGLFDDERNGELTKPRHVLVLARFKVQSGQDGKTRTHIDGKDSLVVVDIHGVFRTVHVGVKIAWESALQRIAFGRER